MHGLSVLQSLKILGQKRVLIFFNILLLSIFITASIATADDFAPDVHLVRPLLVGAEVPDLTLKTSEGKSFVLRTEAQSRPYVLVFYRGHW